MRLTGTDVLAFAVGGIAVAFSGFVLSYSTAGGLAVAGGGGLALTLPFLREGAGSRAVGALAWVAVVALLAAGVGGFLVGFGVFDDPEVRWSSNATALDAEGDRVVLVTGEVTNVGDATAGEVVVTATLVDAEGETIDSESWRLAPLQADTTQFFYVRFEGGDEMRRFDDVEVQVDASE